MIKTTKWLSSAHIFTWAARCLSAVRAEMRRERDKASEQHRPAAPRYVSLVISYEIGERIIHVSVNGLGHLLPNSTPIQQTPQLLFLICVNRAVSFKRPIILSADVYVYCVCVSVCVSAYSGADDVGGGYKGKMRDTEKEGK